MPKIAIIHDSLIEFGGGEKVLIEFAKLFPKADIYTSCANPQVLAKLKVHIQGSIYTSWLNKVPFLSRSRRLVQLFSPFIWSSFQLNNYDVIISHGSYYLANLVHLYSPRQALRVHYTISPAKNIYGLGQVTFLDRVLSIPWYSILKVLDKLSTERADHVFAVSADVQKRIKDIYNIQSDIVYPLIKTKSQLFVSKKAVTKKYYCYIGRLSKEKNVDLIIRAFNTLKLPLVIAGEGKELTALQKIANSNIHFVGFKSEMETEKILRSSFAMIHASKNDDFPLAITESLSYGVPIIAFYSGGPKEMVTENRGGLFFRSLSVRALIQAVLLFQKKHWKENDCFEDYLRLANSSSENTFENAFSNLILKVHENKKA